MSTTRYDLLIKGGTVIDPSQGLHAVLDVALSGGKVAALEEGISESRAGEVLDRIQPDPVHVAKGAACALGTRVRRNGAV